MHLGGQLRGISGMRDVFYTLVAAGNRRPNFGSVLEFVFTSEYVTTRTMICGRNTKRCLTAIFSIHFNNLIKYYRWHLSPRKLKKTRIKGFAQLFWALISNQCLCTGIKLKVGLCGIPTAPRSTYRSLKQHMVWRRCHCLCRAVNFSAGSGRFDFTRD